MIHFFLYIAKLPGRGRSVDRYLVRVRLRVRVRVTVGIRLRLRVRVRVRVRIRVRLRVRVGAALRAAAELRRHLLGRPTPVGPKEGVVLPAGPA